MYKYIRVTVGHMSYPVTIFVSKESIAMFYGDSIPSLKLPQNWTREIIRNHIKKYIKTE